MSLLAFVILSASEESRHSPQGFFAAAQNDRREGLRMKREGLRVARKGALFMIEEKNMCAILVMNLVKEK